MDPGWLKEEFGDRITFWDGGVDTQKTLPFGTPEEVAAEIFRSYKKSFVESCKKEIKDRLCGALDREINIEMAQEKNFPCAKGAALFVIQNIFGSPQNLLEKLGYLQ